MFQRSASSASRRNSVQEVTDQTSAGMPNCSASKVCARSASRAELRDFFEVDAKHIALATLHALARTGAIDAAMVQGALASLDIDPEKPNPALA